MDLEGFQSVSASQGLLQAPTRDLVSKQGHTTSTPTGERAGAGPALRTTICKPRGSREQGSAWEGEQLGQKLTRAGESEEGAARQGGLL